MDTVNEFEKRRDIPVRYNRGLWVKTIQAMKRVDEIKQKRQKRLWVKRMNAVKDKKRQQLEKELERDIKIVTDETIKRKLIENMEKEEEERKEKTKAKTSLMEIAEDE